MRLDTLEFSAKNKATEKEPVFVIELSFDELNTDLHYLTSEVVSGLAGNIINDTLKIVSSTSQKISPDKALSTIGSIKFECRDIGITALQRTKLGEDKGLNGKRVRVYQGYKGLLWSQFQLIQTQVIDSSITYKDGLYTFHCADIQREMRNKIFTEKETRLTTSITEVATTLPVYDTTGFEVVYQVPSAQGKTLLRGLQQSGDYPSLNGVDHIGLLKIEGDDDDFEIVIYTGKDANNFTGVVRGVLGTKAKAIEVDPSSSIQNAPKISEYVYIEMPAVKAAYAIMTGSLYGHAGEFLPDHWHLGISSDYIKTSSFVNIGTDLWDTTDDDAGYPVSIRGSEEVDGKKFIEENIAYMIGVYAPILHTGEISLKRLQYIGPNGSYVRRLDETNVVSYGALTHRLSDIVNSFVLKWNWSEVRDRYTRTSVLIDPDSIARHQETDAKVVELKTLHGSRHSDNLIRQNFEALRSRYAGPPITLKLTLTPDQNDLEVGDIVRVDLTKMEDFSSEDSGNLNRNFEVQSVRNDWVNGSVIVDLFASSQRASDVVPTLTETVNMAFITSEGTEINAANFPSSGITSSGGVTTITGAIDFTGHADMNNASAIYYCTEDLTFDASAIPTVNLNTQIRVAGFTQINCLIDGAGRGLSGGQADSIASHLKAPISSNLGSEGVGVTSAQGGMIYFNSANFKQYRVELSHGARIIIGDTDHLVRPILNLNDQDQLEGMPQTLIGTSGSSGGGIHDSVLGTIIAQGGDGGNSGAGLAILSQGMSFGVNGSIDLSGEDGRSGSNTSFSVEEPLAATYQVRAGGGAGGAPGCFVLAVLDSSQTFPDLSASNLTLNHGACPEANKNYSTVGARRWNSEDQFSAVYYSGEGNPVFPASSPEGGGGSLKQVENTWEQNAHIVFLDTLSTPQEDEADYVASDPTFTLTEYKNTPSTPDGNISTIEVSVTPPSDTNYSYSIVEYRKSTESGYTLAPPASNESLIEVPSDGAIYHVRVRAVSKKGFTSPSGPEDTITVTNINGLTNTQLAAIYPFDTITGLSLQNQAGTVFNGRDAMFEWDDNNSQKIYFNYYEVQVYDQSDNILRTEKSVSPLYVYDYVKNSQDYLRLNATRGVYADDLEIRVKPVSKYFNDQSQLYSGSQANFTVSATTTNDRENLRFIQLHEQDLVDDVAVALQQNGGDVLAVFQDSAPQNPTVGLLWFDTDNKNSLSSWDGSAWIGRDHDDIAAAILNANNAQTTADGKAYVFDQEGLPSSPAPTEGDLWYQASTRYLRRHNGGNTNSLSDWDLVGTATTQTSDLTDDANLGGTADWDNVSGRPVEALILNNLIDKREWVEGASVTALTDDTSSYGLTSANSLERLSGPYGADEIAWRVFHANASDDYGGFHFLNNEIDNEQTYRSSVWIRGDSLLGNFEFCASANSQLETFGGSAQSAPNAISNPILEISKWYLAVLITHPHSTTRTTDSGLSGLYDPETGENVLQATEYKFRSTSDRLNGRARYVDSNTSSVNGYFARPRLDIVNGSEVSISQLMLGYHNFDGLLNENQQWDEVQNKPLDDQILNSLIDRSGWELGGSLPPSGWSMQGDANENALEMDDGPYGQQEIVWKASRVGGGSEDGGFYTNWASAEDNKSYRFSVWTKWETAPTTYTYFQAQGQNSSLLNLSGSVSTANFAVTENTFTLNKWYLLVGYIHPKDTPLSSNSGLGGIYDPETGQRVFVGTDYKMALLTQGLRLGIYQFFAASSSEQKFCRPRIDVIDGSELSLSQLLLGDHIDGILNNQQQWDDVDNIPERLTDVATTGLNITQTHLGYFNGSEWKTYMDSGGQFYLDGDSNNYISWDGTDLTVRGDVRASSVAASVSLSSPVINGGTITASTFETQSGAGSDKVKLDTSDNSLVVQWDGRELARIGKSSGGWEAGLEVGDATYANSAARFYSASGGNSPTLRSTNYSQGTAISGSGDQGSGVSGHSLYGAGVIGSGVVGFNVSASSTGYGRFRGSHITLIQKSDVTLVGGDTDLKGRSVVVNSILEDDNDDDYLLEVAIETSNSTTLSLGVVAASYSITSDFAFSLLGDYGTIANANGSTHDICIVYTNGIAPVKVSTTSGGNINKGDLLRAYGTLNGVCIKTTSSGATVIGKALESYSTGGGAIGVIPVLLGGV